MQARLRPKYLCEVSHGGDQPRTRRQGALDARPLECRACRLRRTGNRRGSQGRCGSHGHNPPLRGSPDAGQEGGFRMGRRRAAQTYVGELERRIPQDAWPCRAELGEGDPCYRNNWAHQNAFSCDDADRALDSIARLLTAVSARQAEGLNRIEDGATAPHLRRTSPKRKATWGWRRGEPSDGLSQALA